MFEQAVFDNFFLFCYNMLKVNKFGGDLMTKKYTEDDYCDIYQNRICDNCGDCLEMSGVDTKAINIDDIAKNVEENKFLEEELKKLYEEAKDEESLQSEDNEELDFEVQSDEEISEDYVDAFEHIEYLDDLDVNDDAFIEDMTEEIFPGVRRLKTNRPN